ncbi:hypothetical protein DPMN_128367 [Dreissena polymorpha]|uniref:Uncharacterized protein n=1 Tax=Dreissena polymorpha TaxID=45954 RepID=A0A9D4JWC7_DREPO|nr:hypothetical protein DPMN_128367 [Dreissena polymorpha]
MRIRRVACKLKLKPSLRIRTVLSRYEEETQEIPRNLACIFIEEIVAHDQNAQVHGLDLSYAGRICHKTNVCMTRINSVF